MKELLLAHCLAYPVDSEDDEFLQTALKDHGIVGEPLLWNDHDGDASGRPVLIRSCWDYHLQSEDFLAWLERLAQSGSQIINPLSTIRWNANKRYLVDLAANGVSIVPTSFVARRGSFSIRDHMEALGLERIVVKPTVSASATGAWTSNGAPEDQERFDLQVAECDLMVQPFLPEISTEGEVSVIAFDRQITHTVRKTPAAGDWRVQYELGGQHVEEEPDDSLAAFAQTVLATLRNPPCYARVDCIRTAGEWHLMELELIEPFLFLNENAGKVFASAIARRL